MNEADATEPTGEKVSWTTCPTSISGARPRWAAYRHSAGVDLLDEGRDDRPADLWTGASGRLPVMGRRLHDEVIRAAGPLEPGERPEIATAATLHGPASTLRQSLSKGLIAGALTAGTMTLVDVPRPWGILLTDRRLFFFAINNLGKVVPGIEFTIPRADVRVVTPPTGRVMRVVQLVDRDGEDVLRLHFAAVVRRDGEALATALGAP